MAATFGFSALGTIIPQNKAFEYYVQNYPASQKVLGFLDYNLLLTLDLNHIYTAWYFYLTLAWLGASLAACTSTRQWPAVKVAQRWRFQTQPASVVKQGRDDKGMAEVLPGARVQDLALQLMMRDYQVFVQGRSLYAFKGLAGRLGPIGVHAAMLLVLAGTSYSGFGGFKGTVMLPEGEEVRVEDVISPVSRVAMMPGGASKVLHVNGFSIDYRPDGSVAQFYSDLSMLDPDQAPALVDMSDPNGSSGQEVLRKRISVNSPLRYKGLTMYQTDWSLAALNLRVLGPDPDAPAPLSPDTSTSASTASPSSTPSFTDASSSPNPNAASPAGSSRGSSPLAAGEADRRSG
ncbi:C-type cytochrome synthesis protein 1, partial [Haematococcus lacustris]